MGQLYMTWLKRIEPVLLHQGNELPYIIVENGVKLCFDNFYAKKEQKSDYNISFLCHKNKLKRRSTIYYGFKEFPVIVPFSDIIELNDIIVNGRLLRTASKMEDIDEVATVKSSYLSQLEDHSLQSFADELEQYHKTFILHDHDITAETRLLLDVVTPILHQDWYRTAVTIAHAICTVPRKYCWTHALPDLSIACYGYNIEEFDKLKMAIESIEIPNSLIRLAS